MAKQQVIGAVLILVAAGMIGGVVLGPFAAYQDVQSHETTQAEVIQSGMESATEEDDDGETEVEYYPRVEYAYTIDGTEYTDNRIFHQTQVENEEEELRGKEFDNEGDAQDVVDRYQSGTTATVYYDPGNPDVSYLEDPSNDLLVTSGMMGVFGLLSGGLGIGGILGRISLGDE